MIFPREPPPPSGDVDPSVCLMGTGSIVIFFLPLVREPRVSSGRAPRLHPAGILPAPRVAARRAAVRFCSAAFRAAGSVSHAEWAWWTVVA